MIQSVNRAIDLLQAVAARSEGVGVSELARACGLKVQTAQTLLKTLAFRNLLAFDPRLRNYRLGSALVSLGERVDRVDLVAAIVTPRLEAMHRETGETVSALTLQGGQFVLLKTHGADSNFTRQPSGQIMRHPAEMASGRVLAGRMPKAELTAMIAEHIRSRRGPEAKLTAKELAAIIARARSTGESTVVNQEAGVHALAVAVPVDVLPVHLALACTIPMARHHVAMERHAFQVLREHAARLGADWRTTAEANSGQGAPATQGEDV